MSSASVLKSAGGQKRPDLHNRNGSFIWSLLNFMEIIRLPQSRRTSDHRRFSCTILPDLNHWPLSIWWHVYYSRTPWRATVTGSPCSIMASHQNRPPFLTAAVSSTTWLLSTEPSGTARSSTVGASGSTDRLRRVGWQCDDVVVSAWKRRRSICLCMRSRVRKDEVWYCCWYLFLLFTLRSDGVVYGNRVCEWGLRDVASLPSGVSWNTAFAKKIGRIGLFRKAHFIELWLG